MLLAAAGSGEAEVSLGGAAAATGIGSECVEIVSGASAVMFWRTGRGSGEPSTAKGASASVAEGARAGVELGASGDTEMEFVWGSGVLKLRSGSTSGSGAKPALTAGPAAPIAGAKAAGAPGSRDGSGSAAPAELGLSGRIATLTRNRQRSCFTSLRAEYRAGPLSHTPQRASGWIAPVMFCRGLTPAAVPEQYPATVAASPPAPAGTKGPRKYPARQERYSCHSQPGHGTLPDPQVPPSEPPQSLQLKLQLPAQPE